MKIPSNWEIQQTAFIDSSDIDFRDFINLYKKYTAKPYSFLVTVVDQGIKQVEALKVLKPEENQEPESTEGRFPKKKMRNNEIKNKIDGIKNWEENIKQEDLKQISIYIWFSAIWKR